MSIVANNHNLFVYIVAMVKIAVVVANNLNSIYSLFAKATMHAILQSVHVDEISSFFQMLQLIKISLVKRQCTASFGCIVGVFGPFLV